MTENDDRCLSEILSTTIEYDPKTYVALMYSLLGRNILRVGRRNSNGEEIEEGVTKICTGSTAELRIKPMLSCIGDVDIMYHYTDYIALPKSCLDLKIRKLEGMSFTLKLFNVVPLPDYPGYANIHVGRLLSWNTQTNRYHIFSQEQGTLISSLHNNGKPDLHFKDSLRLKYVYSFRRVCHNASHPSIH